MIDDPVGIHVVEVLGDVNNETIGHANLKNRSERTFTISWLLSEGNTLR